MKNIFLFLFLTVFQFVATAQETYLDSLKIELEAEENPKAYLYHLLSTEVKQYRLAVINNKLGLIYQYESLLDSALACHNRALYHAYKTSQNNQEIGVSYNKIGIVYYYKGELDTAIVFFEKALPFYTDNSLKANSYNNLAIMYKYNSNPDLAIKNYLTSLDIYESLNDTLKQIFILSNIGALYIGFEDYKKAEYYLTNGLNLAQNNAYKNGRMNCNSNLANMYNQQKRYDLAIPMFQNLISYYEETKQYNFVIIIKNNLAESYDGIGKKKEALNSFLETLQLMNKTGIENNKEAVLLNIGSVYEEMGNYEKALIYNQQSLQFALKNDMVLRYESIYKNLSTVFQKLGIADSALFYKERQIQLKDSLDNVEKEKKMMELEAEHHANELSNDLIQTQSNLDLTEKDRKQGAKRLTYLVVIILFSVSALLFIIIRYKRKKKLSEKLIKRIEKKNQDISILESTLDNKNEEIENLAFQKIKGKLPFPKELEPLTEREKEVLIGVKEGLKDVEIADKLFLSVSTIRTHLRKAYVKIDARNRAEAIQFISKFEV